MLGVGVRTVSMSGKTGSAQSGTGGADHAWFIAFAPSDTPSVAVAVLVEHGMHGASAAAPVAKAVVQTMFNKEEKEIKSARQAPPPAKDTEAPPAKRTDARLSGASERVALQ